MATCSKCGAVIPEGKEDCVICGSNPNAVTAPPPFRINGSDDIAAILLRIEETERKNQKLLKSISSATAILAGVTIIQILILFSNFSSFARFFM